MLVTAAAPEAPRSTGVPRRPGRQVLPARDRLGRRLGYALLGVPLGAMYAGIFAGLVASALLAVYGAGLLLVLGVLMLARGFGGWERALARRMLGASVEDCLAVRRQPGVLHRLRLLLASSSTWRTLAWLGVRVLFAAAVLATLLCGAGLTWLLLWYPTSMGVARSLPLDILALLLTAVTWLLVTRVLEIQVGAMEFVAPKLLAVSAEQRIAALRQASVRLAERTTVARDLHDTIGHALTASLLQASAAQRALRAGPDDPEHPADPDFARQALGHIEENTRHALAELDRALVVLGDPSRAGSVYEAPPDLGDVGGLLAGLDDAGLPLDVRLAVAADDVPAEVSELAYRVVQEGTTNVLRHAGPTATLVEVAHCGDDVVVRVRNEPGSPGPRRPGPGRGRGLQGLRERVSALGGTLTAGVTPEGGFELAARLPGRGLHG